jgi:hypothetical protein
VREFVVDVEYRHLDADIHNLAWFHPIARAIRDATGIDRVFISNGHAIINGRRVELPENASKACLAISNGSEWYARWFVRPFVFTLTIPDPW